MSSKFLPSLRQANRDEYDTPKDDYVSHPKAGHGKTGYDECPEEHRVHELANTETMNVERGRFSQKPKYSAKKDGREGERGKAGQKPGAPAER